MGTPQCNKIKLLECLPGTQEIWIHLLTAAGETGVMFLETPLGVSAGSESKLSWTLDSAEGPPVWEGAGASELP